jgi:hypothetical protein
MCMAMIPNYLSKVVHIYDAERGWSGANEHYTQQNRNLDYRIYFRKYEPIVHFSISLAKQMQNHVIVFYLFGCWQLLGN